MPLSKMVMGRTEIAEEHLSALGGYRGVYDLDVRLAQMDREGIAAELIYHGDARVGDLAHNVTNSVWPFEIWAAGVRAYNRWVQDTFGAAPDRLLLIGAIGSCTDMDATIAELGWLADQGFTGTFAPGFLTHPDMPPLFDPYWEPLWAECEARGLAIVVHAGFGFEQGFLYEQLDRVNQEVKPANGSETDLVMRLASEVFTQEFFSDIKARRPMWQMMYGGVFDRYPDLRLVMTEIRLDWIPAILGHLDALFEPTPGRHPGEAPPERVLARKLPGRRVVRAQGRGGDAPRDRRPHHPLRSRLPPSRGHLAEHLDWLRDAFAGVPENELRAMLGENAITFFGLDRAPLAAIAGRIGPTVRTSRGRPPSIPSYLRSSTSAVATCGRPKATPASPRSPRAPETSPASTTPAESPNCVSGHPVKAPATGGLRCAVPPAQIDLHELRFAS